MKSAWKIQLVLLLIILTRGAIDCLAEDETPPGANFSGITVGSAEPKPPVNAFYVDPANGSMKGDGSKEQPWSTLAEVLAAKLINGADSKLGKVHAGDVVYLLSGNHGSINLQNPAYLNTEFIRIEAAPGHTPVIEGLFGKDISNWVFKGITFQSVKKLPDWAAIVYVRPAKNVIFTENTIYSQPDSVVLKWTPEDWAASASMRGAFFDGTSISVVNNTIKNVQVGLTAAGDRIHVDHNLIQYFSVDGIVYYLSNSKISRNRVVDHYPFSTDGFHSDGMQGQGQKGASVYSNIAIENNVVIESTGEYPNIPLIPSSQGRNLLQGIDTFDGDWSHITVSNNVVAVSANHAIAFYGTQDSLFVNNTVVKLTSDTRISPWIAVVNGKNGRPPTGNIIRNNVTPNLSLPKDTSVTCDHNLMFSKTWQSHLSKKSWIAGSSRVLVQPNRAKGPFDFNLAVNSPAIGRGSAELAPEVDINGRGRNADAMDIGAFCHTCQGSPSDVSAWNAGVTAVNESAEIEKAPVRVPQTPVK